MRLFKLCTTCLVLAFIGLFFWQNAATFRALQHFSLNLYIREPVHWSHYLYTLLFFAGFLGLLTGILLMLKPYRNMRRLLAQERQQKPAEPSPLPTTPPPLPPSEEKENPEAP